KASWLGMRATIPGMIAAGGGRIVNVASLAGLVGLVNLLAYSAAKGGLIAMSRQVAMEYAKHQIKVNTIAPGIVDTPILGNNTPEMTAAFSAATPLGRLGRPEEIAGAVASVFTDDGAADYGELGGVNTGAATIAAFCRSALAGLDASQHLITNEVVELDGDRGRARCYFQAQHVYRGAEGGDHYLVGGTYEDELVRTPEGWRIRRR